MEPVAVCRNPNSSWMNVRGSWAINLSLLVLLKLLLTALPGISVEASWLWTNLIYNGACFVIFHWLTGAPFDVNQDEYDDLTLWEQIDEGQQFTQNKKFLTTVPILLFLISTHYTHYNIQAFVVNVISLSTVVIPKMPSAAAAAAAPSGAARRSSTRGSAAAALSSPSAQGLGSRTGPHSVPLTRRSRQASRDR